MEERIKRNNKKNNTKVQSLRSEMHLYFSNLFLFSYLSSFFVNSILFVVLCLIYLSVSCFVTKYRFRIIRKRKKHFLFLFYQTKDKQQSIFLKLQNRQRKKMSANAQEAAATATRRGGGGMNLFAFEAMIILVSIIYRCSISIHPYSGKSINKYNVYYYFSISRSTLICCFLFFFVN